MVDYEVGLCNPVAQYPSRPDSRRAVGGPTGLEGGDGDGGPVSCLGPPVAGLGRRLGLLRLPIGRLGLGLGLPVGRRRLGLLRLPGLAVDGCRGLAVATRPPPPIGTRCQANSQSVSHPCRELGTVALGRRQLILGSLDGFGGTGADSRQAEQGSEEGEGGSHNWEARLLKGPPAVPHSRALPPDPVPKGGGR